MFVCVSFYSLMLCVMHRSLKDAFPRSNEKLQCLNKLQTDWGQIIRSLQDFGFDAQKTLVTKKDWKSFWKITSFFVCHTSTDRLQWSLQVTEPCTYQHGNLLPWSSRSRSPVEVKCQFCAKWKVGAFSYMYYRQ